MNRAVMPDLLFPKPRPAALERKDRKAVRVSLDEAESRKVRKRSQGRCEIVEDTIKESGVVLKNGRWRCRRRAHQVHHMLGGNGVRGRGESAMAERKQHTCHTCHADIGAHVLVRIARGTLPHFRDKYKRVT